MLESKGAGSLAGFRGRRAAYVRGANGVAFTSPVNRGHSNVFLDYSPFG